MRIPALVVVAALLLGTGAALAAPSPAEVAADEKVLADARIPADGPALVQFFRKRSLTEEDLARLEQTVRRLGAPLYADRERATRELIEAGRPAVAYLKKAVDDPDLEIAHRVERCLTAIGQAKDAPIVLAATRLMATRKPEGATAAILGYLPFAEELAEEELLTALATVGSPNGTPDPA